MGTILSWEMISGSYIDNAHRWCVDRGVGRVEALHSWPAVQGDWMRLFNEYLVELLQLLVYKFSGV